MGGACSNVRDREEVHALFLWGNLREGDHMEDPGVDGRIIFKMDLQEVGCGYMDWIDLTQVRERRQALVNVVKYLWVP